MHKAFCTGFLAVAIGLPMATQAEAQSTGSSTTISACVGNLTGLVREVSSSKDCLKGLETFQQWNVQGPVGPQGPSGPVGPQGAAGTAGAVGAQGPAGPLGATGPNGALGAAGLAGATGAGGPAGPVGATGAQGLAGPAGATGAQGLSGAKGDTGAQGPAGSTGATGAMGLQGAAGPVGAPGAQGPAGSVGATGAVGPAGPSGATGAPGPAGTAGSAGATGPSGPTGPTGATGPQGPQVWTADLALTYTVPSFGKATGVGLPSAYDFNGFLQTELLLPYSCTPSGFTATVVGAAGTSTANIQLATASSPYPVNEFFLNITAVQACGVNANNGAVVSCTQDPSVVAPKLPAGAPLVIYLEDFGRPGDFENTHILTTFNCN